MTKKWLAAGALALSVLLAGCNVTVPVNAPTSASESAAASADAGSAAQSGPASGASAPQSAATAASGEAAAPVASPSSTVSAGIAGSADGGQYITEQAAKDAALASAGLAEGDTQWMWVRLDYEDGRAVYDVEFCAGAEEYDYEIDALTGEILSMDREAEYRPGSGTGNGNGTGSDRYITEEEARAAALAHAGLTEADVTFVYSQLDWDDGRAVYDVEFYAGATEYDYEIDAITGAVASYDADAESYAPGAQSAAPGAAITARQAEEAALAHAGFAAADVARLRTEYDWDDGRGVYEVEWRVGRTEYSYEISAADGSVLSWEADAD